MRLTTALDCSVECNQKLHAQSLKPMVHVISQEMMLESSLVSHTSANNGSLQLEGLISQESRVP